MGHTMFNLNPTSPKGMVIGGFSSGSKFKDWLQDVGQTGFLNDFKVLDVKSPLVTFAAASVQQQNPP